MCKYNEKISRIEEGELSLAFCAKFDEKSDIWNLNKHKHPYIEILYFIDGFADINIQNQIIHAALYNLVLYPSEVEHQEKLDFTKHQEIICIWVDSPKLQFDISLHISDPQGQLHSLLSLIIDEYKNDHRNNRIIDHYIKALFINIIRDDIYKESSNIDLLKRYICDHISYTISINELASLIHVSESYLIRLFKKSTGITPVQYINKLKIETAKRLLNEPKITLEKISQRLGFGSVKYFSKLFKQCTTMSPAKFRSTL